MSGSCTRQAGDWWLVGEFTIKHREWFNHHAPSWKQGGLTWLNVYIYIYIAIKTMRYNLWKWWLVDHLIIEGGCSALIDLLGINYYYHNPWGNPVINQTTACWNDKGFWDVPSPKREATMWHLVWSWQATSLAFGYHLFMTCDWNAQNWSFIISWPIRPHNPRWTPNWTGSTLLPALFAGVPHFQWICRNAIVSYSYTTETRGDFRKILLEQVWDIMGPD